MKSSCRLATALALLALGMSGGAGAHGQTPPASSDDPFEKLKTYDFQSRASVEAIRVMIDQAMTDKAQLGQIEQRLDAVLDDPMATFAGRQEAARFLWIVGSARSVPTLTKLLNDPDERMADVARYALERDADPAAGKALQTALSTTKAKSLLGVINSIGNRGDGGAVGALKPFTASSDSQVSEAAITALGKIGTTNAFAALRTLPSASSSPLIGQAMLRCAAHAAATGKKGDAQRIYAGLADEHYPSVVRVEALRGLANLSSPEAARVGLADLKSSDAYLQQSAARIIGMMPDARVTTQAIALWPALPPLAQGVLLTSLADRREPAAAPIARIAAQSQEAGLRVIGIEALGRVGGANAVPTLADIAVKGAGSDRNTARETLAAMSGAGTDQAILKLAQGSDSNTRTAMMSILAERATPTTIGALLDAARGSDPRVAVAAVRALERVGGSGENAELVKLLVSTQNGEVRDAAKDAVVAISHRLGDAERNRAAEPVLAALPGASSAGKAALLPVLAEVGGDRAFDELTRATSAADPDVKQAAITALADTWPDTRPLPTLLSVAKTDTNNRCAFRRCAAIFA